MLNEFTWIKNKDYTVVLKYIDSEIDYYTNVKICAIYLGKQYQIFNDNLLYLKNIIKNYIENIDNYIVDINSKIDIENIGLLQNKYYYCISQEIPLSKYSELILDDNQEWIGLKYSCFEAKKFSTWLYKRDNKINVKITPLFDNYFYEFSIIEYKKFVKNYRDIMDFEITELDLIHLYNFIDKIYI